MGNYVDFHLLENDDRLIKSLRKIGVDNVPVLSLKERLNLILAMRNLVDLRDDKQEEFYRGLSYAIMSPFYLICLEGQIFGFIQEKEPSIQDFIQRIENEGFVDYVSMTQRKGTLEEMRDNFHQFCENFRMEDSLTSIHEATFSMKHPPSNFVNIFARISSMIKPPIFLQMCDEDGEEEYNKLYIFQGGGMLEFDPFFNDNDLVKRFLTED